jgi:MFS family permease
MSSNGGGVTAGAVRSASVERTADAVQRASVERLAVAHLAIGAGTMALVCGAIIASGWFAGVLQDRYERVFWLGAVLAFVMVAVFAAASFPGGVNDRAVVRRVTALIRVGLVLFVLAPALCIGALVADFFF